MVFEVISIALFPLLFAPVMITLSAVIFLAAIGKSLGVRYLYMNTLLFLFEWGKQRLKKEHDDGEEDEEEEHIEPIQTKKQRTRLMSQRLNRTELDDGFKLQDVMSYCQDGISAIVEDEVTQRFDAAELSSWNLLTRTNTNYQFISLRLTIIYFIGWFLRYCILLPFRLVIAVFAVGLMVSGTFILASVPDGKLKRWAHFRLSLTAFRIFARSFSAVITFHNRENRAKGGGICVANHTSPIDIVVLGCDNCYAMVGQAQGGFFGFMQRAFSRAESHIWFDRSEAKDRLAVARRLRAHIEDKEKLPILIFPEGTCINNTSIMMFKKGSFEVGGVIYPVAIKYNYQFADPFWNSSRQTLSRHLLMIFTSWALVCDVWYMEPQTIRYDSRFADPFWNSAKHSFSKHLLMMMSSWALVIDVWYMVPQIQREGETGLEFANRVKASIAEQGGLVDLQWDGGLKRSAPKPTMKQKYQEVYSRRLKPVMEESNHSPPPSPTSLSFESDEKVNDEQSDYSTKQGEENDVQNSTGNGEKNETGSCAVHPVQNGGHEENGVESIETQIKSECDTTGNTNDSLANSSYHRNCEDVDPDIKENGFETTDANCSVDTTILQTQESLKNPRQINQPMLKH